MTKAATMAGLTLALLWGLAGPSSAQAGPGGYGLGQGQGSGGRNGGWGMRPRNGQHRMISREVLDGPPAPAVLRDSVGLAGDQLQHYSQQYSSYIAQTAPARDSLRSAMREMRTAFQSGDRSGARDRRDTLSRQASDLSQRDRHFEKVLKQDLTKDQQKRYDKWKDAREKAERQHREDRYREAPAGNL